jgi:predicted O-linked N-acetylglucosamine transferase (SPINDLY family)
MEAIDYRLTDDLADPVGMTDGLNVEKLWRLPTCAWCFLTPKDAPEIKLRTSGPITFGSFNALAKINRKMVAIWAEVLKRALGSRLLLKSNGADRAKSRQRLIGEFAESGIASDRIELRGWIGDPRGHLDLYGQVDIALDTFPYTGTTTTCEALWMGVPVVTLAGRTHVSRVGVSLLTTVGLPELVAQEPNEYVSIATALANDEARLAGLRAGLRNRVNSSPLVDGVGFAAEVDAGFRTMWREWCGKSHLRGSAK